jgi:hypothetical protein
MPRLLNVPHFSHTSFHRAESGRLVAEASDLGIRAGRAPLGRLYDDACDLGFVMDRVGREQVWVLEKETAHTWEFTDAKLSRDKLIILND